MNNSSRILMNLERITKVCVALAVFVLAGCNSLFDNPTIPEGYQSPEAYHSKVGGLQMMKYASNLFIEVIASSIVDGGLLGDELGNNLNTSSNPTIDQRYLPETNSNSDEIGSYKHLQRLRGQSNMARAILEKFAPDLSPALRGKLMIMDGYARVLLADQYCAGVPLSTINFDGDYTLKPGLPLLETYEAAITMFDSAIAISSDSSQLILLATLGKARALVGANKLKEANDLVAAIPTGSSYSMKLSFLNIEKNMNRLVLRGTIVDREGGNGLPYISSGDPRTKSTEVALHISILTSSETKLLNYPDKYSTQDSFDFQLGSGIDARLIEAEYQLSQGSNQWLTILNGLRTNGSIARIDTTVSGEPDTIWAAGSGGIEGLRPLEDLTDNNAKVELLFKERAFWLFMTGNRLPDMRRLVRQYGRHREEVFPTGLYSNGQSLTGDYGSDINMPIPWMEKKNNLFKGCMNRDQ